MYLHWDKIKFKQFASNLNNLSIKATNETIKELVELVSKRYSSR